MENALWYFNVLYTYILFYYMKKTYGFKYENMKINGLAAIAFYAIHAYINSLHIAVLNILTDFVMLNIFSFLLCHKRNEKVYFNSIFQFYLLSLDLTITSISSLFNGMVFTQTQTDDTYLPFIGVNFIVIFATYRLVIKQFKEDYIFFDKVKNRRIFTLGIIIQYFLILILCANYHIYITNLVGIVLMVIIICVTIGSVLYLKHAQDKAISHEELRTNKEYINELEKITKAKNLAIKMMSRSILEHTLKTKKAKKMELTTNNEILKYEYGNEMIDIIIALAKDKADKNGINLRNDIDEIEWAKIENEDTKTILSNLISNALDTISKDKNMVIRVRQSENFIMAEIIHSVDESRTETRGEIIYPGTKNLLKIRTNTAIKALKNNDGDINFELEKENFIVTVYWSISEK